MKDEQAVPPLAPRLKRIMDMEYPRLSAAEMARRRGLVETALAEAGCDHLVFCGANRAGSCVQWLTQWPVTAEAVGVFTPGLPDALFLQYVNHPPLARKLASEAEVAWGGESSIRAAVAVLEKRGARENRVGVIGPLNFEQHGALAARFGRIANLNRAYVRHAPHEIGRGARLVPYRRMVERSRHGGAARRARTRT